MSKTANAAAFEPLDQQEKKKIIDSVTSFMAIRSDLVTATCDLINRTQIAEANTVARARCVSYDSKNKPFELTALSRAGLVLDLLSTRTQEGRPINVDDSIASLVETIASLPTARVTPAMRKLDPEWRRYKEIAWGNGGRTAFKDRAGNPDRMFQNAVDTITLKTVQNNQLWMLARGPDYASEFKVLLPNTSDDDILLARVAQAQRSNNNNSSSNSNGSAGDNIGAIPDDLQRDLAKTVHAQAKLAQSMMKKEEKNKRQMTTTATGSHQQMNPNKRRFDEVSGPEEENKIVRGLEEVGACLALQQLLQAAAKSARGIMLLKKSLDEHIRKRIGDSDTEYKTDWTDLQRSIMQPIAARRTCMEALTGLSSMVLNAVFPQVVADQKRTLQQTVSIIDRHRSDLASQYAEKLSSGEAISLTDLTAKPYPQGSQEFMEVSMASALVSQAQSTADTLLNEARDWLRQRSYLFAISFLYKLYVDGKLSPSDLLKEFENQFQPSAINTLPPSSSSSSSSSASLIPMDLDPDQKIDSTATDSEAKDDVDSDSSSSSSSSRPAKRARTEPSIDVMRHFNSWMASLSDMRQRLAQAHEALRADALSRNTVDRAKLSEFREKTLYGPAGTTDVNTQLLKILDLIRAYIMQDRQLPRDGGTEVSDTEVINAKALVQGVLATKVELACIDAIQRREQEMMKAAEKSAMSATLAMRDQVRESSAGLQDFYAQLLHMSEVADQKCAAQKPHTPAWTQMFQCDLQALARFHGVLNGLAQPFFADRARLERNLAPESPWAQTIVAFNRLQTAIADNDSRKKFVKNGSLAGFLSQSIDVMQFFALASCV